MSTSVAWSSIAPVGSFAFSVPGSRIATVPATDTTNSGRIRLAASWATGRVHLVDDDLRDAVPIAQVQEDQLAVVAPPMDPAGQAGARPCVGGAELPARVRAIGRGEAGALR